MDKQDRDLYGEGYLDRVFQAFNGLRVRFLGLADDLVLSKASKGDKSIESLVETLCRNKNYFAGKGPLSKHLDVYSFLKLVLERDAPLHEYEGHLLGSLGIKRDHSRLSLPLQNAITAQSVAQVLWYLEKHNISSIEKMKKRLLDKKSHLDALFKLSDFNPRTIRDWIGAVFPLPKDSRRGRPSKKGVSSSLFDDLIPIPGVFLDDGATINFPKLQFALACITRVLKAQGWQLEQIMGSKFVDFYTRSFRLTFFPLACFLINDWVREAFFENSRISD